MRYYELHCADPECRYKEMDSGHVIDERSLRESREKFGGPFCGWCGRRIPDGGVVLVIDPAVDAEEVK